MFYLTFTVDNSGPHCASIESASIATAITNWNCWAAGLQSGIHATPTLLAVSGTKPRGLTAVSLFDHKEWFGCLMGDRK